MTFEFKEKQNVEKNEIIQSILSPMLEILDKKNITNGITIIKENGKLYVCFDKNYLSNNNQLILEKAIKGYFQQTINTNEQNENITLNEVHKRLLTN